jgi:hypothetical protein
MRGDIWMTLEALVSLLRRTVNWPSASIKGGNDNV